MPDLNEKDLLTFAEDVMARAGEIALKYFRTELEVMDKAGGASFDPVTRADREVETYIRGRIRESYPDHAIIGEEYGAEQIDAANTWLIDPIDGTRGYVAGTPMWGILLGLISGDCCTAGFMRQPLLDETYIGSAAGAFILDAGGRRPLHTRKTDKPREAILCCTHINMFQDGDQRECFDRVLRACRFSRFGTDCYGYALLARGLVDMIVEADLEPYDIVPLVPVVEAAGGVITDWQGKPPLGGGAVAASANVKLHEQLLALLNK